MKIMGLDYGDARTGVAISDLLCTLVGATTVLPSRNEEKLLATMTDDQKELFIKYADCVREFQVMAECLLFQNSFRLGGRMMLEVMRGGMGDE